MKFYQDVTCQNIIFLTTHLLTFLACSVLFITTWILLGSITSHCSGKWARTHPPKERLDVCDFLFWFKPIMSPPVDFRLAKIVAEIITSKHKSPPLIHHMAKRFWRPGDTRRSSRVERNTTFCSIVCCELFFQWLLLERFCIFKDLFKAL